MSESPGDGPETTRREPADESPRAGRSTRDQRTIGDWVRWVWRTDRAPIAITREITVSVLFVLLLATLLFATSGVWPPLVAVESDSMEPQIMTGDLVFIVQPDRFADDGAVAGTGVVPASHGGGSGYSTFDGAGDVIVFAPNGNERDTPIIHRAHLWVEEGDDWVAQADAELLGSAEACSDVQSCPAPHDGFITRGDNNPTYDQVQGKSAPVKPEWVIARAQFRIPWIGHVRLVIADLLGTVVHSPLAA